MQAGPKGSVIVTLDKIDDSVPVNLEQEMIRTAWFHVWFILHPVLFALKSTNMQILHLKKNSL